MSNEDKSGVNRRQFVLGSTAAAGTLFLGGFAPAFARSGKHRPTTPYGVMSGDITQGEAVVWSRSDKPAQMWVDVATNPEFNNSVTVQGPNAISNSDFTSKLNLTGLPSGQTVHYRIRYQSLEDWQTRASRRLAALPHHRQSALTSVSCGPATQPGKAGESMKSGAACVYTKPCARPSQISLSTVAIPFTPMAR